MRTTKNKQVRSSTTGEKSGDKLSLSLEDRLSSPKGVPYEQGEGMREDKNSSSYTANIFETYGSINNV